MNPIVYHIASGQAFFTSALLLIAAGGLSCYAAGRWKRYAILMAVMGAIAVAISSTPLPIWFYSIAALLTVIWLATLATKKYRRLGAALLISAWLLALLLEVPFHLSPRINADPDRTLTVIGDSVTAGMGGGETSIRWPQLLSQQHGLTVQDISHIGETAGTAFKRVKQNQIEASLVIVEIGGNDILGSTTPPEFETDLDCLLQHLTQGGRKVVMFELPLPPFYHRYGDIQRRLARKYDVALIPKRVLLSVIARNKNTLDSIHLTQQGHTAMADAVSQLLEPTWNSRTQ